MIIFWGVLEVIDCKLGEENGYRPFKERLAISVTAASWISGSWDFARDMIVFHPISKMMFSWFRSLFFFRIIWAQLVCVSLSSKCEIDWAFHTTHSGESGKSPKGVSLGLMVLVAEQLYARFDIGGDDFCVFFSLFSKKTLLMRGRERVCECLRSYHLVQDIPASPLREI